LYLDYEDFLRQHEAMRWTKDHPLYKEFRRRRISTMEQFREFIS